MSVNTFEIEPNILTIQKAASSKINEKVKITVEEGSGNFLSLGEKSKLGLVRIFIRGNNNKIIIENSVFYRSGHIRIMGDNQTIRIGQFTDIQGCYFLLSEGCDITVGEHCMFSKEVTVRTTDAHSVLDLATGERINKAKSIHIGNHIWLGAEVMVTKGVSLPDDCIVGARSICNRTITESHTVIAGIPAKVVKRGVTWDSKRI